MDQIALSFGFFFQIKYKIWNQLVIDISKAKMCKHTNECAVKREGLHTLRSRCSRLIGRKHGPHPESCQWEHHKGLWKWFRYICKSLPVGIFISLFQVCIFKMYYWLNDWNCKNMMKGHSSPPSVEVIYLLIMHLISFYKLLAHIYSFLIFSLRLGFYWLWFRLSDFQGLSWKFLNPSYISPGPVAVLFLCITAVCSQAGSFSARRRSVMALFTVQWFSDGTWEVCACLCVRLLGWVLERKV